MIAKTTITTVILLSLVLSGCGTTTYKKDEIIPKSDFTMKEIYDNRGKVTKAQLEEREHTQEIVRDILTRPTGTPQNTSAYELNRVDADNSFRKLPNPTLYLYFPAKISKDGNMPIHAWMTEFKMFDKDEYALPGELAVGAR